MLKKLLLTIATLTLSTLLHAQTAPSELQHTYQMRSLAYSATANIMVFYNLDSTPFDPKNHKQYHQDLDQLQQLATQNGDTAVLEELAKIRELVAKLEALPQNQDYIRNVAIPYRNLLNPLFEAQQRLDQALEQRYSVIARSSEDSWQQGLHALSLDHSRAMQQYSMLTFTSLSYLNLGDTSLKLISERIEEQFNQLKSQNEEKAPELKKLATNFNFIRKKLVDQPRPWIPALATFYLSKNVNALTQLSTATN